MGSYFLTGEEVLLYLARVAQSSCYACYFGTPVWTPNLDSSNQWGCWCLPDGGIVGNFQRRQCCCCNCNARWMCTFLFVRCTLHLRNSHLYDGGCSALYSFLRVALCLSAPKFMDNDTTRLTGSIITDLEKSFQ